MNNPLRWRQRFDNFERSFLLLDEVINRDLESFSQLEKEGIVQRFEVLIELSWKTLKDYLENEGYDKVKTGKYAIRQAFQDEIITEAESWMKALEIRNITSHTYNEVVLQETLLFIKTEFYPIVRDLYHRLKKL
ncbi:MAG: nucleotidyltransferase [Gammaproteobacteria bacterium]|nr:nucleotidyltransferase [Gammaproteobacteria bacterium]